MDKDKYIQTILDRFMTGNSNLEEENELSEYFRSHEVKPEWQAFKEMFAYFDNGMQDDSNKENISKITITQPMWKRWILIAVATAAILFFIITFAIHPSDIESNKNTSLNRKETTFRKVAASKKPKDSIIENITIAQAGVKPNERVLKKIHVKENLENLPTDSADLQKIDQEINSSNDILLTAEKQYKECIEELDKSISTANQMIEVAYAVSYHHATQDNQYIIRPVLISPSESLDKAVALSSANIIYK